MTVSMERCGWERQAQKGSSGAFQAFATTRRFHGLNPFMGLTG
jgi:hypothetical protein